MKQSSSAQLYSTVALISLMLMCCVPFMVSYHRWPETTYYSQVVAFIFGALSLVALFKPSKSGLAVPPTALVPAVLIVLLGLQWFAGIGVYWQETTLTILYLSWAMMLMLTVAYLKEAYDLETLLTWLAYALLFGGLFNTLVVLMQLVGADHFFWTFSRQGTSYAGNLAQVNLLTDYISLSLTSLIYLHVKGRLKTSAVAIVTILFLITLTLAGSRMSWLYVLMISLSFYFFGKNNAQLTWQHKSKFVLLLPLLFGIVQFTLPFVIEMISSTTLPLPPAPAARVAEFAAKGSVRIEYLKEGLAIFSQHPWLGVGWGQYVWYDLIFADTHANHTGFVTHTHNLFLQILVECGVFALLAVLVGSVYWFVQLLKQQNTIERWWLLLIGGIIFVHAMLEYPLWYAHFLGLFVVVVALGDQRIQLSRVKPVVVNIGAGVTLIACLSLIGVTTYQYRQIEHWVNNYAKLDQHQRINMLNDMSAMHQQTLVSESLHLILTRAYSLLPTKQAPLASKIAKYESMLHYVQGKEDIYRYVWLLAKNGEMDKASAYLRRAYTRQPGYAKQFEAQLTKGAIKGDQRLLALLLQLKQLQQQKK